jgi:regulatory protein YycI of two-component signal transduction system YycFG
MDWAKAKSILIAVFLIINSFLAYVILGDNNGSVRYVDSENTQRVTDYLTGKGIVVKGQIPERKLDMFSISVKYKLFMKDDIKGLLFSPEENVEESKTGNTVSLKGKTVTVSIKDNRELEYTDNSIGPAADIDEKACSKKIKEFLARLGMKDDASIRKVEDAEGYKRFIYSQAFKDAEIFNSHMEFYVNDSGIYKARIVWFETVKQAGKRAEVISPVIALLAVPEHNENNALPSREVLQIQQGYYFGTGANEQVDVSVVEEGTAFTVWKITTDTDIIYINAYNEKVEGVEKAKK